MFGDVLIVFLVRAMIQAVLSRRTKSWPIVKGEVTTAQERIGAIGCMVVELAYHYRIEAELYTAIHGEPFLWAGSGKSYLEQFAPGSELIVRVKPGMPGTSFVRDRDLYFHARGYRLES